MVMVMTMPPAPQAVGVGFSCQASHRAVRARGRTVSLLQAHLRSAPPAACHAPATFSDSATEAASWIFRARQPGRLPQYYMHFPRGQMQY